MVRWETGDCKGGRYRVDEIGTRKLERRNVDRYANTTQIFGLPSRRGQARLHNDPRTDGHNEPALLGDRDELHWTDPAQLGMVPGEQCLQPVQVSGDGH